jgi:flagellar biogenesis protein FliO
MIDFSIIFKLILSLLIVIGTLYGLLYFLKKYSIPFSKANQEDIKIRDVKFISKDIGLVTIEFDNKIFLLAFQNGKIEKISEKETTQNLEDKE